MNETFQGSYTSIEIGKISKSLNEVFDAFKDSGSDNVYTRAASSNLILIGPKGASNDKAWQAEVKDVENIANSFSLVHPSRIFIVVQDESADGMKADVAAQCHLVSAKSHICSEIVKITVHPAMLAGVSSVIRANLIAGANTELFMQDISKGLEVFEHLAQISDQLIFDSAQVPEAIGPLHTLMKKGITMIDLHWVRQGFWREQIKSVFDKPALSNILASLETVELKIRGPKMKHISASTILFPAAWMIQRLKMRPLSYHQGEFHCASQDGRSINLKIDYSGEAIAPELSDIVFLFSPQAGDATCPRVQIHKGQLLETCVNIGQTYNLTRPMEDDSEAALIRRYFLIGESTTNYNAALSVAFELAKLTGMPV